MAQSRKPSTKKRESVIVRSGVEKIEIRDSEQMGLKWDKPSAVMTGAGKVKSASGVQEEESAAGPRRVPSSPRKAGRNVNATAAQTVGFGRGAGTGQNKSRGKLRIATAVNGPTSRAEPRVSGGGERARKRLQSGR
jgi:hypothetical protein